MADEHKGHEGDGGGAASDFATFLNAMDPDDEDADGPCLRIMFYRPGSPHASLYRVDVTADLLAEHRESLLIETSTLNFVVLMDGALTSSAEFAYGSGAEAGKTVMNLKYMPDGGAMRLNGQFALELVSDSIASEVSELLFSLPTSEVVEDNERKKEELRALQEELAKAKAEGASGARVRTVKSVAPSPAKKSTARRSRPVKRRRRGRGGARIA